MRVWDVHPGYLSESRLLGEHREIHAVWTVLVEGRKGYANHPETRRWRGHLSSLYRRHEMTVAEMHLRGYNHASPLEYRDDGAGSSPGFVDSPPEQFVLLREKYDSAESGRIPLPNRASEFWAHHKYSIMARGYEKYRQVSSMSGRLGALRIIEAGEMVDEVHRIMEETAHEGSLINAWQHVIGHFKQKVPVQTREELLSNLPDSADKVGRTVYLLALEHDEIYIRNSTILSDWSSFEPKS